MLEAEEPFAEGQTGSSAMPHKRNPELCERICGLARVVRGYAVTSIENVALWHERDISHSSTERITLPGLVRSLLDYMLRLFTDIVRGLNVYPEHMRENLELTQGLVFSQRVLLALIETGLSRQDAYAIVQRNAMRAWKERTPFRDAARGRRRRHVAAGRGEARRDLRLRGVCGACGGVVRAVGVVRRVR